MDFSKLPGCGSDIAKLAISLLSSGGDARITLSGDNFTNRYHSTPYPRDVLAYASSTANDISVPAFRHVGKLIEDGLPDYAPWLDRLRAKVRSAYGIGEKNRIVFAASGTDLEYVALAAVAGRATGGVHNVLLGANEVGSGCIHSAHGRYFADQTARGVASAPGDDVAGLENVGLTDIPVRDEDGIARSSENISEAIDKEVAAAVDKKQHALVHIVHGSKTGLILPRPRDLRNLSEKWGDNVTFVVDACQARLSDSAAQAYLDSGCIVFVTGSKFMGGPPFSGMAVIPPAVGEKAMALPEGLSSVFRKAEWPEDWPGAADLPDEANNGLALRLEASLFELERFHAVAEDRRTAVILAFNDAASENLLKPLGLQQILPHNPEEPGRGYAHPTAMMTLLTFGIGNRPSGETFDDAVILHRKLIDQGIRLGQPVKCLRRPDGGWAGTLRVGLSMPQVSALADLPLEGAREALDADMRRIAEAIVQVTA